MTNFTISYRPKGATTVRSNRAEVAQALCIASQMNQVDTLIVGFRSLSTLDKSIFGSVSEVSHCVFFYIYIIHFYFLCSYSKRLLIVQ